MAFTKKIPVSATWAASIAAFVVILIIFVSADPIGNNFDNNRYYTMEFIFPALIALLGVIIVQRWVATRILISIFMIYEIVMLFVYGGIALAFATWNGDNVIYIAAYVEVYHGWILGAVIAGILPLIYLVSLQRVVVLKQQRATGEFLLAIMRDVACAVAVAIGILLLAMHVTLGISHLVLGAVLGIATVGDLIRGSMNPGDATPLNAEESRDAETSMQSSSKVKNVFLVAIVTLFTLGAGFLSIDEFIKPNESPIFYQVNPRVMLDENLTTLIVLEIGLLLGLSLFKPLVQRLDKVRDGERLTGVVSITILALMWGLLLAGRPILPISASTALIPWSLLFLWAWITSTVARRRRASPGLLGALFLGLGAGTWMGVLVSTDPGIDGVLYIVTGLLGVILLFLIFIYAIINPKFVNGRQDPEPVKNQPGREPVIERPIVTKLKKQRVAFALLAMMLLVVPPVFMIGEAAASPSNFQLLANVNNDCIFYLADPMTRIDKTYMPNFGLSDYANPNNTIAISAAKNEYESVQVVMRPLNVPHYSIYDITFSHFNLTAAPVTFINKTNFVAFRNEYVESLSDIMPDMLVNFSMFAVTGNVNTPIWLRFHVPASAKGGDYNGTVTFTIDDKSITPDEFNGNTHVKFAIKLHVFNFTLPQIPTLKSFMGFGGAPLFSSTFNATMPMYQQYRMMYWASSPYPSTLSINASGYVTTLNTTKFDAFVNVFHAWGTHTLAIYQDWPNGVIPGLKYGFVVDGVNFTSSNYTAYFSNPKYNLTLASYMHVFESYLKSKTYVDAFGETKSWYNEFYMYGYDEIDSHPEAEIQSNIKDYNWIKHTLNMTIPIVQTMGGNDALAQAIDIPCFHNSGHAPAFIQRFKSRYPEVWLYSTRGPRFPNPSIGSSGFQMQSRALAWECFIYNYSHYLIWATATQSNGGYGYGYQGWNGGSLLYNVVGGFAPSARMEVFRDGFEDHDYFALLQHAPASTQRDALLTRVNATMSGFQPIMDYKAFTQLRFDIGSFLSA